MKELYNCNNKYLCAMKSFPTLLFTPFLSLIHQKMTITPKVIEYSFHFTCPIFLIQMSADNDLSTSLKLKVQEAKERELLWQEQLQREAATNDSHLLNSEDDNPNTSDTVHFKGQTPSQLQQKDLESTEGRSESDDSDQSDSDDKTSKAILNF